MEPTARREPFNGSQVRAETDPDPQRTTFLEAPPTSRRPADSPGSSAPLDHEKSRSSNSSRNFHFHLPPEARLPHYTSFLSKKRRQQTVLNEVPIEGRAFPHKYAIRRPRALQYRYKGKVYDAGDDGRTDLHLADAEHSAESSNDVSRSASSDQTSTSAVENREERSTDNIDVQRERLDLFIDLLWVGIISNISEHYYEQSFAPDAHIGQAILEFLVLFFPAWSIWVVLQIFLNSFFMDDILQRGFVVWILILGLIFGNNAPYILNSEVAGDYLIITYIVAKNSVALFEVAYSFFIPWLRKRMLYGFFLMLPSTGLWIAATLVVYDWTRVYLLVAAILYDYIVRSIMSSPLEGRLLKDDITKARNEKHILKRYENFFIIALGEGVFLLIRGSPAGQGFGTQLGRTVLTFTLYYVLHWLYFNGDQTKTFVHALYRRWYLGVLWGLFHIALYANLVLLSSGMLYLIDYTPDQGETNGAPESASQSGLSRRAEAATAEGEASPPTESGGAAGIPISTSYNTLRAAEITVSANLAIIMLSMTVLALLNRPLDKPRTLLVNNRYLRLLPRMCSVVVFSTVWLCDFPDPTWFIGLALLVIYVVFMWEWNAGLERGGKFFEPKDSWKNN